MARLYRPYIPLAVRVAVAERQARIRRIAYSESMFDSDGARLAYLMRQLFGDKPHALDHNPALVNRRRYVRNGKTFYDPPANDPDYLIYREAGPGSDHDIKTRVRGEHGQHSDLALARIEKRRMKKKAAKRTAKYNRKYNWPKGRKIRSRKEHTR